MRNYFKYALYLVVLIYYSSIHAGSYDDFFTAVRQDDSKTIESLLQRGFDANTRDPANQHGLYLALREPSPKVAKLLIDWPKTDIDAKNAQGESPLMIATLGGQVELAKLLIAKGADVNKPGWTALHYAATSGNIELINLLLENHAYIDAESPNRTTPLMMAAHYGTPSAVKLLLEEGADPLLKNEQDLSAVDFAQRAQRQESAEIIGAFVRGKQPKGTW